MSGNFSLFSGPDRGNRVLGKGARTKLESSIRCEMRETMTLGKRQIIRDEYGINVWEGPSLKPLLSAIGEMVAERSKTIQSELCEKHRTTEVKDWMAQSLEQAYDNDLELCAWRGILKLAETANAEDWTLVYVGD